MKPLRHVLGCMLMLMCLAPPVQAQTVSDTASVEIQGALERVAIDSLYARGPWQVGDTIHFRATAFDADGDTVMAMLTWASSDTLTLKFIDPAAGTAVALRKARGNEAVRIYVMAQEVDAVRVGWFNVTDGPGTMHWDKDVQLTAIGEQAQLCGYLLYQGRVVAQNQAPPPGAQCPYAFGGPVPLEQQVNNYEERWRPLFPDQWLMYGFKQLMDRVGER